MSQAGRGAVDAPAGLYGLVRPWLFRLDPERAHALALAAVPWLAALARPRPDDPTLAIEAFGLRFPNPVGLAAGFDKDAVAAGPLLRLGFGSVEVGSLTPRAQAGNPRPRLHRLAVDGGIVNRMGFNNAGHAAALARLAALRERGEAGIVGVNLGANKDAEDPAGDYALGVTTFAPVASYLTLNLSSPNTPGLRDLQRRAALEALLGRALEARERARPRRPVLLKLAPDLTLAELDDAVAVALAQGIDGIIVSNTTVTRPASLRHAGAGALQGGLSGIPLFTLSTRLLAETAKRVEGRVPLVGAGGIDGPAAARAKIAAGASLVQLYSGLVYSGPGLVRAITRELALRPASRS